MNDVLQHMGAVLPGHGTVLLHVPGTIKPALSTRRKDLTTCGTEATLPPDVPRDIPDETVKALVDCLVIIIFLAATTTTVSGVPQEPVGPRVTLALTVK